MQKIDFKNYPSTISPINGTNLNLMQDNVEDEFDIKDSEIGDLSNLNTPSNSSLVDAINEVFNKVKQDTLYESTNGTTGNITLSDSAANYDAIEILFGADGYNFYTKIYDPDGKHFGLMTPYVSGSNANQYLYTSSYLISGTQIQFETASNTGINSSNSIFDFGTNSYIRIYKVIGYKKEGD